MKLLRFESTDSGETIKCANLTVGRRVLTLARAETSWYTKGVERKMPVYRNKKRRVHL